MYIKLKLKLKNNVITQNKLLAFTVSMYCQGYACILVDMIFRLPGKHIKMAAILQESKYNYLKKRASYQ